MSHRDFPVILRNERGMALLITLMIVSVLFAVSLELNRRVRMSSVSSSSSNQDFLLFERAEAGVNIAKTLLIKDAYENKIDSVQEDWADPEVVDEVLTLLGFNKGDIHLTITDELSKIQVNALIDKFPGHKVNQDQKQIWEALLSLFISSDKSEDQRDPREILNSLIDWLDDRDGDTVTGLSGAETLYYESLEVPYKCPNGQFNDLSELPFVKGISEDLFVKAESLDGENLGGKNRFQMDELCTVFGVEDSTNNIIKNSDGKRILSFPGKININTASIPVIASLLPFSKRDLAIKISEHRLLKSDNQDGYENDLSVKDWYADIADLNEEEKERITEKITYSSNIFSIDSKAVQNGRSLVLHAVLSRQKDKNGQWLCQTLRQYVKPTVK
jgi:general secretion pathway protein K